MVNKLWATFIIIGIVYSIFTGNLSIINEEILTSASSSLEMVLKIFPVMSLWLGISKIAEESSLLSKFSKFVSKVLKYIFPEIPSDHPSLSI